jgi:hypothetical protein
MSEPDRLVDSGGDDPGVALLRAARDYRLSEETRQRALVAAGLAGSAAALGVGHATAKSAAFGTKVLGWGLAGAIGVAAAVGGYRALVPGHRIAQPTMPAAPLIGAPGVPSPPTALSPVENAPLAAPSASTITSPRIGISPTGSHVAAPAGLQAELAALDAASNAVARGDAVRALALLDSYGRDFPRGSLVAEASVLRAEALERAGRHSEAVQLARGFVKRYPKSPLTERMQRIAGD